MHPGIGHIQYTLQIKLNLLKKSQKHLVIYVASE